MATFNTTGNDTMNTTANDIRTAYTHERAKHPDRPALQALRTARYNVRMAGADLPRWAGEDVTMMLPRGERIVMRLEHDSDADIADRFGATIDYRPARHAREYGAPDWWQDRDGLFHCFESYDRFTVDLDHDNRDWHRAHGMARHDAWLRARQDRERAAQAFRDAMADGYVGYIVTLYDAHGDEVEADSCWGFEASDDSAGHEAYSAAVHMAKERAEHWEREVIAAREKAASIRATVRDIIRDMRKARGADLPHACEALRGHLATMRRAHSEAMAIIAGSAA